MPLIIPQPIDTIHYDSLVTAARAGLGNLPLDAAHKATGALILLSRALNQGTVIPDKLPEPNNETEPAAKPQLEVIHTEAKKT